MRSNGSRLGRFASWPPRSVGEEVGRVDVQIGGHLERVHVGRVKLHRGFNALYEKERIRQAREGGAQVGEPLLAVASVADAVPVGTVAVVRQ